MEKVTNVNLGGFAFKIDEKAYNKLKKYLADVNKNMSSEIREEVVSDIESRIAELFFECNHKNKKEVINEKDVDEVIEIMGLPTDEDNETKTKYTNTKKKLYRDVEKTFISGVSSGLAHYLGVDLVFIRLVWIVLLFSGVGILPYIVLWIVMPQAKTTTQKLEMRGKYADVDNITVIVEETQNAVSGVLNFGVEVIRFFVKFTIIIFKFMVCIVGFLLLLSGIAVAVSLLFGLHQGQIIDDFFESMFHNPNLVEIFVSGLLILFTTIFTLLCIKLVFSGVGNISKTLTGLTVAFLFFFVGTVMLVTDVAMDFTTDVTKIQKYKYNLKSNNLYIEVADPIQKYDFDVWALKNDKILSNSILTRIIPTENDKVELVVKKRTNRFKNIQGDDFVIDYNFKFKNDTLYLDSHFSIPKKLRYRSEKILLDIYVPKNKNIHKGINYKYIKDYFMNIYLHKLINIK